MLWAEWAGLRRGATTATDSNWLDFNLATAHGGEMDGRGKTSWLEIRLFCSASCAENVLFRTPPRQPSSARFISMASCAASHSSPGPSKNMFFSPTSLTIASHVKETTTSSGSSYRPVFSISQQNISISCPGVVFYSGLPTTSSK